MKQEELIIPDVHARRIADEIISEINTIEEGTGHPFRMDYLWILIYIKLKGDKHNKTHT